MSDNESGVDSGNNISTNDNSIVGHSDMVVPKKRGRPKGSTSKNTAHVPLAPKDDLTNEIQKLILKKRIKKYVNKYMSKYQKHPVMYNEPLYSNNQHVESESEDDEPMEEEEASKPPPLPLQTKRHNKYRDALLR